MACEYSIIFEGELKILLGDVYSSSAMARLCVRRLYRYGALIGVRGMVDVES